MVAIRQAETFKVWMFPRSNDRPQSYNSPKNNQDTFLADFRKGEIFKLYFRASLHIHQGQAKQCKTFVEAFSAVGDYTGNTFSLHCLKILSSKKFHRGEKAKVSFFLRLGIG